MSAPSKRPMIIPATSEDYTREAVAVYKAGGIIAYPTESFYGLGVDPYNEAAVEKLFLLKGRPADKPIPLIVSDMKMVEAIASDLSPVTRKVMERHWPGPLTIIIKAKEGLPKRLTAGTNLIAIRIPGSETARRLVEAIGAPLTTTSANPSNMMPATTAEMVDGYLGDMLDLIIDGGSLPGGLPSTIIDLTRDEPRLVRKGLLPFSEVLK
ncbi:TsaC protein (YrdC domain) required for threonylcarbamoyladenosine t(6)A37 modification in tRNA [hydrothermal vent metagenome]|uniref:L-threonylcarbamoyladenylate synthase n=1 Tax=hydrothermal vent metagenome TaxID=652676 RepID=A0A3B0QRG2_9ZZZZ